MKKTIFTTAILVGLMVSSNLLAQTNDREHLGDNGGLPIYGLKHSNNFEIECKVKVIESDSQSYDATMWVDTNFQLKTGGVAKKENIRVALSFPDDAVLNGYVGVEVNVTDYLVGKYATGNYFMAIGLIGINSDGEKESHTLQLIETSSNSKTYNLIVRNQQTGELGSTGTCVKK